MFSGSKIYIFPHTSPLFSTFFQKNIEFLDNSSDFTLFKLENRYSIAYQSQSLLQSFRFRQKYNETKSMERKNPADLTTINLKPQTSNLKP